MVEIVPFPLPPNMSARDAALRRLASRIGERLGARFTQAGLANVQIDTFIDTIWRTMREDGFPYDPAILDAIASSSETMKAIEIMFVRALVTAGHVPPEMLDL